jgi:hypothetical protein
VYGWREAAEPVYSAATATGSAGRSERARHFVELRSTLFRLSANRFEIVKAPTERPRWPALHHRAAYSAATAAGCIGSAALRAPRRSLSRRKGFSMNS